ncbi:universal stress protein [Mucilaginibacter xinganensis]|uniref:Universal stress protein n=1 Tax=Mucilaginibacter xinganensis TaxID=1234841 RepID=A0A223P0G9_9SPHI|nr:universal stress protein [Mucilaginibacter xinganensis]ASU35331.1 Universal stress protein [Mucilaginibacter xinganensis]
MKNILVLTDLSENAAHAAELSVIFGGKLNANLLLYHTFLGAVVIPNYEGGPLASNASIELEAESRAHLDKLAGYLQPFIDKLDKYGYKPVISCQLGEGSLGGNVLSLIETKNVEIIVMGARSGSSLEHILLGSDTNAVMQKATCPVLVVPMESNLQKLTKVVFATDFEAEDIVAIQYLVNLAKLFDFELEIVHVALPGKNNEYKKDLQFSLKAEVSKLTYSHIVYKNVRGNNVIKRLNRLCEETDAGILALSHHQHSFFGRLLQKSTTKEALSLQKIPLLVFPLKTT